MTRRFYLFLIVWLATLGAAQRVNAQTVTIYQTNADQSLLLAQQASVSFGANGSGFTTITVNPATTFQQMDGFGASFTDSSAYLVYNKLSATQQSALMQSLFSATSGIGVTFLRQPMGASDFSAQGNFSYDDVAAGQTDVNLTSFSIAKDLTYTIPVLKQALAINPNIKVEMLPWSPPAWMKESGTMNGGNFNTAYYAPLANYFVKAIQAYQAQGVPVYAIAVQNEPENSNSGYPTESLPESQEAAFIGGYLGPTLASNSLGDVKIFGYEHNWNDTSYPEELLGDPVAGAYTAGISWHCYGGPVQAQTTVEQAYPSKGTWFTECSSEVDSPSSFRGDLGFDMENLIIGATNNWARSVSEWNLALDQNSGPQNGGCTNCRGFVTIDDSVNPAAITYNVDYYAFGHAAKFVTPGAYRILSNSAAAGSGGIEDVAFQNPNGSIVLIAFNDGLSSTTFDVNWSPNNTNFSYTLPGGAVATFTWMPTYPPAISNSGIISASDFGAFPSIAPGSFAEIYGSGLAMDTRGWSGADFTGIDAPTSLDGTYVSIGGQAAFVNYISPGQVNVLTPSDLPAGPQPLILTSPSGISAASIVNVNALEPGLLAISLFDLQGVQYTDALNLDGTYVVPVNAIAGIGSHPASPGDTIVLYGVGFGPVTPDTPAGQLAQTVTALDASLVVSIGGMPAVVQYAGLAPDFTGLYQFNVTVPNVPPAAATPLAFTLNGVPGAQTLSIAIQ